MNKLPLFLPFLLLLTTNFAFGSDTDRQEPSKSNQPDSILFQTYLDSIEKYIYQDSREIIPYKQLCEQMIKEGKA